MLLQSADQFQENAFPLVCCAWKCMSFALLECCARLHENGCYCMQHSSGGLACVKKKARQCIEYPRITFEQSHLFSKKKKIQVQFLVRLARIKCFVCIVPRCDKSARRLNSPLILAVFFLFGTKALCRVARIATKEDLSFGRRPTDRKL